MPAALLIGLALVGQSPAEDPRVLVARLVSPKSAERASAEASLIALGERAADALEVACESSDLELRGIAAAMLDRIEGRLLVEPSRIAFHMRDNSPAEAAAEVTKQTGITIGLEPPEDPRWGVRTLTIDEEEPLALWDALDRIAKAAHARVLGGGGPGDRRQRIMMFQNNGGRRNPARPDLVLRPSEDAPSPPSSDEGAFRVILTGLKLHQVRNFARTRETVDSPEATSQFTAEMQVRVEPRLVLASLDDPVVVVALDDKGQSLVANESAVAPDRPRRGFADEMSRGGPIAITLRYPENPGKSIARLGGTIRALIVGRRGRPASVPLIPGERETTFSMGDDATLTVHEVRPGANPRSAILVFTITDTFVNQNSATVGLLDPRAGLRPPPSARGQIDFLDAEGRLCQSFDIGQHGANFGEGTRTTLTIQPPDGVGPPTEARYHPASWTTLDVPFEFRDVPMP